MVLFVQQLEEVADDDGDVFIPVVKCLPPDPIIDASYGPGYGQIYVTLNFLTLILVHVCKCSNLFSNLIDSLLSVNIGLCRDEVFVSD